MKVLVIEDEALNLEILSTHLTSEGYDVLQAMNGREGMTILQANHDISLILLDRNMPIMNGIEFLHEYKKFPEFGNIPVIMQTAISDNEHVSEGIRAGAYYYLTKPYTKDVLFSIINAAITDSAFKNQIAGEVYKNRQMLGLLNEAFFEIKTMDEAQNLSYFLSNCFPHPETVVIGLAEIIMNAVEHGNLGITYHEKSVLMTSGKLRDEIAYRESLPENQNKKVYISFKKDKDALRVTVKDQGKGFKWQDFIEIKPERASDPNGRGVFMARTISFDELQYNDIGNEVCCVLKLKTNLN